MNNKQKESFEKKYKKEIWFKNSDKIWEIELKGLTLRVYLRKEIDDKERNLLKLAGFSRIKYEFIVKEPPQIRKAQPKTTLFYL